MELAKRIKLYEQQETSRRTLPFLPIIARLDGRAFHTLTKGLDKPFDSGFCTLMSDVAKAVMYKSSALVAYTQSDEISLIFYSGNIESEIFFGGKLFKMTSILASLCTAEFNNLKSGFDSTRELPSGLFDCRVFQVPSKTEACNYLVWREQDSIRNSILSLGQYFFSHSYIYKKSCEDIKTMIVERNSRASWGACPDYFKYGNMFRKVKVERPFTKDELEALPEKHEARSNPDLIVIRSDIERVEFEAGSCFRDLSDRENFIFGDEIS
jgi:tRNA(His) 5'-end guanylyltransferase